MLSTRLLRVALQAPPIDFPLDRRSVGSEIERRERYGREVAELAVSPQCAPCLLLAHSYFLQHRLHLHGWHPSLAVAHSLANPVLQSVVDRVAEMATDWPSWAGYLLEPPIPPGWSVLSTLDPPLPLNDPRLSSVQNELVLRRVEERLFQMYWASELNVERYSFILTALHHRFPEQHPSGLMMGLARDQDDHLTTAVGILSTRANRSPLLDSALLQIRTNLRHVVSDSATCDADTRAHFASLFVQLLEAGKAMKTLEGIVADAPPWVVEALVYESFHAGQPWGDSRAYLQAAEQFVQGGSMVGVLSIADVARVARSMDTYLSEVHHVASAMRHVAARDPLRDVQGDGRIRVREMVRDDENTLAHLSDRIGDRIEED